MVLEVVGVGGGVGGSLIIANFRARKSSGFKREGFTYNLQVTGVHLQFLCVCRFQREKKKWF